MAEPIAVQTSSPIPVARQAAPSARAEAPPEIRRVAEEFEAMALAEMLGPMFEALDTDGLGGGGFGEQMFRPMMVQQYAHNIARSGGIGLADSIIAELMRIQAAPPASPVAETAGRPPAAPIIPE